ncbi:MAG: AmmeMemoRadiSam system protein A, partial [Acidobacteriota bacterium]|nr:AmmeMemoRadiSam system protein A [Acidobacteriota bacterium]
MSPQPENAAPPAPLDGTKEATGEAASPAEYSHEERALLLRLVHQTIERALPGGRRPMDPMDPVDLAPPTPALSPHLAELRGAFVTLHLAGQLRGCVGFVQPARGLYHTVMEAALNAAFHDPRFLPVSTEEAPELEVEISVLSPLQPIAPEEVVVGRHGLVVSRGSYRGLLLPQVAVENGWNAATFLEQTCLKAGLPADAW